MTGTIVNAAAIVIGGLIGVLIRKGIPQNVEATVMQMIGLAVAVIGLNGMISAVFTVTGEGRLESSGGILLLVSLVAGGGLGEILDIDGRLTGFGLRIEKKIGSEGFAKGFISASLIFSIGAMSIVGAMNDGLTGDSSVLLVKSAIDCVAAIVLASSLGIGVIFSAVTVFLYQGLIALGAGYLSPVLSGSLLDSICMVGYCVVICIGTNFIGATKIKTANLLPALLVPVVYNLMTMLKNMW